MLLFTSYHTQRLRRLQEEANQLQQQPAEPAPAENVAVAAEENINEIAQPIDEEVDDAAVPLIENPNQPSPGGTPANADDDNNRLPMIALLRTFVLSFFTSLIPETPAVWSVRRAPCYRRYLSGIGVDTTIRHLLIVVQF